MKAIFFNFLIFSDKLSDMASNRCLLREVPSLFPQARVRGLLSLKKAEPGEQKNCLKKLFHQISHKRPVHCPSLGKPLQRTQINSFLSLALPEMKASCLPSPLHRLLSRF